MPAGPGRLVICHVARSGTELGVALDHLVDGIQEILLRRNLRRTGRNKEQEGGQEK